MTTELGGARHWRKRKYEALRYSVPDANAQTASAPGGHVITSGPKNGAGNGAGSAGSGAYPTVADVRAAYSLAAVELLAAQTHLAKWASARAVELTVGRSIMSDQLERQMVAATRGAHDLAQAYRLIVGDHGDFGERVLLGPN